MVSEERQSYKCYGCGVSGDVIEFVMQYDGLDFKEAVEKIAGRYNISVEWGGGDHTREKESFYDINRLAARFFYKSLRRGPNPAMHYAATRGLTKETMHAFGIGFAPDGWQNLTEFLKEQKADEGKSLQLGLVSRGKKGGLFDRFRNRLMFPIQSTAGKVIGFGGRILGAGEPKYLNSQETPVFQKKNNLYGLFQTKKAVQQQDQIILVEGYMDVVSLYQNGVENVAASLGTALTEEQARLISRYTKNVVLCYDSDAAGINAALRGMDILYKQDLNVRVFHVTDGKDPDDFIKSKGREAFYKLVEEALPYGDYWFSHLEKQYNLSDNQDRVRFLMAVVGVLQKMTPVEADMYSGILADRYGLSRESVRKELEIKQAKAPATRPPHRKAALEEASLALDLPLTEKTALRMLVAAPVLLDRREEANKLFRGGDGRVIYLAIAEVYKDGTGSPEKVAATLEPRLAALWAKICAIPPGDAPEKVFVDCLEKVLRRERREEQEWRRGRIGEAEKAGDAQSADRLLRDYEEQKKQE